MRPQKIFVLILCTLLIHTCIFSQEAEGGQYRNSTDNELKLNARGKAFAFFIIEDTYFATATLGTEFIYKRHSLGVDATYFRWRYEHDDNNDKAMFEVYEKRKYFMGWQYRGDSENTNAFLFSNQMVASLLLFHKNLSGKYNLPR